MIDLFFPLSFKMFPVMLWRQEDFADESYEPQHVVHVVQRFLSNHPWEPLDPSYIRLKFLLLFLFPFNSLCEDFIILTVDPLLLYRGLSVKRKKAYNSF